MPKTQSKGPDLLALAMRRARDDVAAGRVPARPTDAESGSAPSDHSGGDEKDSAG